MTSTDNPTPVLAETAGAPVERRRRTGGRGGDRTRKTVQGKYMNLINTYSKTEVVTQEGLEAIHEASLIILEEIGMDIILPEARERMKAAGADVTPGSERVRFDRNMIMDYMSSIPKTFTMHARNPLRNVEFGGNNLVFAQTASEPFVADREGDAGPAIRTISANSSSWRNHTTSSTCMVVIRPSQSIFTHLCGISIAFQTLSN